MWQHCSVHWNHSTKWNHPSPLHFSINLAFRHFSIFTYYSITSSSAIMMTQTLCSSYNNSLFRSKAILINLFICLSGILGWLGTGALALWGAAEGRGHVQPGGKMASGGPNGFPLVPMRWLPGRQKQILYCGAWRKNDNSGHKMGVSDLKYRKIKISIRKTKHGNKWPRAVEKANSEFSADPTSPRKSV